MEDNIDKLAEEIVKLFPNKNDTEQMDYRCRLNSKLFDPKEKSCEVARMIRDAGIEVWQAMRDDMDADKFTEKIVEFEKENSEYKNLIRRLFSFDPDWASKEGVDVIGHSLTLTDEDRALIIKTVTTGKGGDAQ